MMVLVERHFQSLRWPFRMKLSQISYFLSVCDTLNFTRAAEQCCISQPSLSSAIQRLEEELGGSLFDRGGKQVTLTPLGHSMRVHFSRIEEAKNAATLAASSIVQGKSETLHVGIMCTLNPDNLLPIFKALEPEFKDTEFVIHDVWENQAAELLLAGGIDCLFTTYTSQLDDRFEVTRMGVDSIVIAMNDSHPFAGRETVTLEELQGERYIDRLRCEFRKDLHDTLGEREIKLQVSMRAEREDFVVAAVANGFGITMMPESSAAVAGLTTCKLVGHNLLRDFCIVSVIDRPKSPVVDALASHISAEFHSPSRPAP